MRLLHAGHDPLRASALLRKEPAPTEAAIKQALQGNVCRCGTYPRIVAAVRMASRAKQGGPGMIEQERYELNEGPAYHFEPDRRELLQGFGLGLLFLLVLDGEAAGQESGRARRGGPGGEMPQEIAAGCTSAKTARSRVIPARRRSARTSAPR